MLIEVNFESEKPIYEQIKRQIIQAIASGSLKKGENLPSVRQMAEDVGINLHTVNKAYNELKSEGYLNIDRRKGAVVSCKLPNNTQEFKDKLKNELLYLISESYLRGIDEEEFSQYCHRMFANLKL
ncbi:GntR family transcriptional regulator [Clostridium sp. LBM24168]